MKLKFSAHSFNVPETLFDENGTYIIDQCNWTNVIVVNDKNEKIKLTFHDGLSMMVLDGIFSIDILFDLDFPNGEYSYIAELFDYFGNKKENINGSFIVTDIRIPREYIFCQDLLVPEEAVSERLEICNSCEFNKNEVCMACGCTIYSRTRTASSHCPIDKWGPIEIITKTPINS